MAENNERTFTQSEVEALFKEFERRLTIKDELRVIGTSGHDG